MPAPIELTSETFDSVVLQNMEKPFLIDFWAIWCVPCQMMEPITSAIAEEAEEYALVGKVNIDDFPEIAERYNILSIPTFLIFYKGELVKQIVGVQEKDVLVTALRDAIAGK